jgi:septal ring factor EnvC (AmiA/AmiB activator)
VHPRLLGGLNLLGWIISTVLALTGWVSHLLGYILLALMLPVTVWMFWPWLKSWGRWWPFALARTVKDLQRLRSENERLRQENRNMRVDLHNVSKELGQTKHDKANLRHACEGLREENERLRNQPGGEGLKRDWLKRECRDMAAYLRWFLKDHGQQTEDQIVDLYHERYQDKVSDLLEQLERQGLYPPEDRKDFQISADKFPRSPMAIRNLAGTLGRIGHEI